MVLGDGFWYFVYNDYKLDRPTLERYLSTQESNPVLKSIPIEHAAGLDYLYKRLSIIALSEAQLVWYVFWDDFFYQNKDMTILQDKLHLFDPSKATSVPYRPMAREDLEIQLRKLNLWRNGDDTSLCYRFCPLLCKQYFTRSILDALYQRMDSLPNSPSLNLSKNNYVRVLPI